MAAADADGPDFWLRHQLGFSVDVAGGSAVAVIECDDRHLNPHGTVHGAVMFAMVDTAMGAATMSVLAPDERCTTIEIQIRYLRPALRGPLRAEVSVLKAGRRVVHLDASVFDGAGQTVARASGSFAVLPARSG